MPAASSPYTPNDYQAIRYRGYNLPVNEAFRAISAQDDFWKVGAARVNQVYNDALNLHLSLEPNKEIRRQFMEQAEKQITKLSSMNLADPSVQRQGSNIFKPLFQDEGIVSDDAATKHIEKVQQDIIDSRRKENGKYYHPNNAMYALDGVYEFRSSKDRMAGKSYLEKAREYEPYYDASPELNTILKNCKPEEYSRDVESGLNIVNYSTKALSSVRLSGCIQAGISDKAKRQLSIDGYVTYKNNPQALRDAYLPMIDNTKSQLQEENAAYSAILNNKDKLSSLSEDQLKKIGLSKETVKQLTPEILNSFDQKVKENQLRIDNFNKTSASLAAGDFTPIAGENLEPIASMVYSKGYADSYAAAFSYDTPPSVKIKPNSAQMMIYGQNRMDLRQDDQQDFLLKMEEMKEENSRQLQLLKNLKTKGTNSPGAAQDLIDRARLNPAFDQDVEVAGDYNKLTAEKNKIDAQSAELDKNMLPKLRALGMDGSVVTDKDFFDKTPVFQNWYNNHIKTLPETDPAWEDIKLYDRMKNEYGMTKGIIDNNQKEIDKQALTELGPNPAQPYLQELSAKPRVEMTLTKGTDTIQLSKSPAEIVNDINSGVATLRVDNSLAGNKVLVYNVNGKEYKLETDMIGHNRPVKNMLSQVHTYYVKNDNYDTNLENKKNALAKTKTIVQKEGYIYPELDAFDPKNPDTFKGRLMKDTGVPDVEEKAITVGQTDLRGNVEVTIHPNTSSSGYDEKDVLEQFRRKYGDALHEFPGGDKYHFIIGGFEELNLFTSPEAQWSTKVLPYIRSMESRVTSDKPQSTGTIISPAKPSKQYGLEITTSLQPGMLRYRIYDESNKTVQIYNERTAALEAFNRILQMDEKAK